MNVTKSGIGITIAIIVMVINYFFFSTADLMRKFDGVDPGMTTAAVERVMGDPDESNSSFHLWRGTKLRPTAGRHAIKFSTFVVWFKDGTSVGKERFYSRKSSADLPLRP